MNNNNKKKGTKTKQNTKKTNDPIKYGLEEELHAARTSFKSVGSP